MDWDNARIFLAIGRASDNSRARDAFTELGLNPLMVEAFRDRAAAD